MGSLGRVLVSALGLALLLTRPAAADPVADFYGGKTMQMVIGFGEGGGYDLYGRIAAEFLSRHIPGHPTIIPVNMPGAGSFKAAEYLYEAAPQDGTYLGSIAQTLATDVVTDPTLKLDPRKLPYLGRLTPDIDVGIASAQSGIKSFDDVRKKRTIVGVSGGASTSGIFPLALNAYAGAKFKLVRGYKGSNETLLAMERGEVDITPAVGIPFILASHPDWILRGTAVILYQNALNRSHFLPQVPTLPELALNAEGRQVLRAIASTSEIGRSILTTPNVPADRLAALRQAFQDMVKDPDFIASCKKRNILLEPATGEAMDAIVRETMSMPPPIVATLAKLMKG